MLFSPSGDFLITGKRHIYKDSDARGLRIWSVQSGKLIKYIEREKYLYWNSAIELSPSGEILASGRILVIILGTPNCIQILLITTGKRIRRI